MSFLTRPSLLGQQTFNLQDSFPSGLTVDIAPVSPKSLPPLPISPENRTSRGPTDFAATEILDPWAILASIRSSPCLISRSIWVAISSFFPDLICYVLIATLLLKHIHCLPYLHIPRHSILEGQARVRFPTFMCKRAQSLPRDSSSPPILH
jgi:hypothetical protein